ncbi:MAG: polysaccharide deacetylase family protein [Clostridia bacterium]|nr:polysaccharide deacetylase family protein [Clostridia bacterium]
MKMTKISAAVLPLLIILSLGVSAADSWYVKRGSDGVPVCPPEMTYLSENGGVFIDAEAFQKGDRVIYLTFDAGYENGNVSKILDVLKKENVPGAFFVLRNIADREPELLARMFDEGHTVCNHTATHKDMTAFRDTESFSAELSALDDAVFEATGKRPAKFYRPPEGRMSEENLCSANELGYRTVLWSFAYADWDNDNQPDPVKAEEKILRGTHPGEIILLHPTSKTNAEILGDLIKEWRAMGYRFGKLEEIGTDEKG